MYESICVTFVTELKSESSGQEFLQSQGKTC